MYSAEYRKAALVGVGVYSAPCSLKINRLMNMTLISSLFVAANRGIPAGKICNLKLK